MSVAGRFEKVSLEEYIKTWEKLHWLEKDDKDYQRKRDLIKKAWSKIKLPVRATGGSAGYDFFVNESVFMEAYDSITIPTGIRAYIENGYFLMLVPRSGLGFKHGFSLENTIGIVDSDYYYADNEGHIMAKCSVDSVIHYALDNGIFNEEQHTAQFDPTDAVRWSSHEEDLVAISKQLPDMTFRLSGEEEFGDERWEKYFKKRHQ